MDDNKIPTIKSFHLQTKRVIPPVTAPKIGNAYIVDEDNFPVLDDITCYTLEVWEDCMRIPHWHPNAYELGYVVSGMIEVLIWRSPGETAMFTLSAGMCWFIPQSALHSLNNIGNGKAQLLVGFSSGKPKDMDLPVAFNGIPIPVRDAYTSPHKELRKWKGVIKNPLIGAYRAPKILRDVTTGSPYAFDLAKVTPLFSNDKLGSVVWGIQSNWSILQNISVLRAHLKPQVARDAIWYPDAGTLYVVTQGEGQFHIVMNEYAPTPFNVKPFDYIFIPAGILHTFLNTSKSDFEVIAFFTLANPQPEVSLAVSASFFPNEVRKAAMTSYYGSTSKGDPLKHLKYSTVSPYLLPIKR